jgi:uncharacterized protein
VARALTNEDAANAIWGGSVLACGGGGWVRHGEVMGDLATRLGVPHLVQIQELEAGDLIATVSAIGAPAARDWEIRPLDYVRALERLILEIDAPVAAVMTAQNGSSTTLNGWIQSAVLEIPVLDAAGDIRAHPTGKLGAMGVTEREGYESLQVVYGGNRRLHGTLEVVVRGTPVTADDVLRDVSVRAGGFIASARNPLEAGWVAENGALGAISYALDLGAAMREAAGVTGTGIATHDRGSTGRSAGRAEAVMEAIVRQTGGRIVAEGDTRLPEPVVTKGGWDHGSVEVGEVTLRFLNEHMAADRAGERIGTYPDVLTLLSLDDGRPIAVEDLRAGLRTAVLVVPKDRLILSSSTRDRGALAEVERIIGIDLVSYALGEEAGER